MRDGPKTSETSDEAALITRARAGDDAAFAQIVAEHAGAVFRIACGLLDGSDAEDVTQEVFIRVHRGLPGFRGGSKLSTWIYRIATNVALKRRRRRRVATVPMESAEPRSDQPDPSANLHHAERRQLLHSALEQLPEPQRAVVVLRGLEGLSFQEVAHVLGIQRPTAESRMARAKQKLRLILGQQLDEAPRGDD